jgi:hypothetical protein
MRRVLFSRLSAVCLGVALIVPAALLRSAAAQDKPADKPLDKPDPSAKSQQPQARSDASNRITIEVTGGAKDVPVENASVYVKYVEERVLRKDKKVELNVKTSRDGLAHVPNAPMGRALVQVIAEGWKTYGRWYDITEPKQIIKIHLERPPKWY